MEDRICSVKNRSSGMVVYTIPDANIRREFMPNEVKKIKFGELEQLSFQPGGRALMTDFLQITAEEVTKELNIHREPEYNMSVEDVENLIVNGSLDAFLDCLDFAPMGVIDIIKAKAVEIPMNDIPKREALKKKTGFDVDAALRHLSEVKAEENASKAEEEAPKRRVQPAEAEGRRTTPNYKVVKTD